MQASLILANVTHCIHISTMTLDSKILVGLRSTRKKSSPNSNPAGPKCQWDGCEKTGTHRAPVGRDAEGLYLMFCLEHVKEYNKGYNFATGHSDADVARYQKEATTGARQTWGTAIQQDTELPMPSTVRSGTAKALNARKTAAQRQAQKADLQKRKLKVLEARAFETLGLSPDATPAEIRSRYKERLKMHHPDTNRGNRISEDELRASIDAHRILKLNGFC
jgi:curved DNA-binding protein CbpA